jgi:hypothetical protein
VDESLMRDNAGALGYAERGTPTRPPEDEDAAAN